MFIAVFLDIVMADRLLKKIPYTFKDPSLLDTRSLIGGKWVEARSGKTFPVFDPEDNKEVCQVTDLDVDDVCAAIDAASEAFKTFKNAPHRERRWLMRRWADLIKENKDDLAAICTLELGKPFTESLVTVKYGTDFLDWFEGEIERVYGETIPAARGNNRIFTIKQPQGVVAAITPWNSPIAMVTRKVGAAIAAGNTVICKPAPETPLCAIAVAKLFERAGGPPGVLNIITSSPETTPAVGAELCSNKLIRHLSFTGSTAVGRYLHTECSKTFKKTSMELGGNAPFIIFEDANIDKAVDGLISSKFRSSGQTCVCANRIFVHSSIISQFASRLHTRLGETFTYGSVWDRNVNFGPLYSPKAFDKLTRQTKDALERGGELIGEDPAKLQAQYGPNFYPPTIVTNANKDMLFMKEETFGPLAFLVPFETEEEAVAMANNVDAGLASYFYTEDISRMYRVSEALESGMVGCRVGLISACEQPFGGIKDSGMGREGGKGALDEYLNIKSVTVGI
ncbi:succinate-semialdehyde dehydrogenase [Coccidioides immitis RMSCC 3703]|nr:succinate-semialdehyde dehydrogenase [Coccidioides immitis RMSCC 2394]KMU78372.1 succinate-semialdehyde dehydrogenase [Coccidioides immitis RMSCC 3703]